MLGNPLSLGTGLGQHVGEHVLHLRHVGHDVLNQHQGDRIIDITFPLSSQHFLMTTAKIEECHKQTNLEEKMHLTYVLPL